MNRASALAIFTGRRERLTFAVSAEGLLGIAVGWLSAVSKAPIPIRLATLSASVALPLAFDLPGQAVTPR